MPRHHTTPMTTVWECVPTCPGSGGDLSLDHLAEGALYAAEAAGGVPQTRCYRLRSGNKRGSGSILTCGNNLSGLCQDTNESTAQTRQSPAWLSTVIWRFARTSLRPVESPGTSPLQTTTHSKQKPHLQGRVDLIFDVFDNVAFHSRVATDFQHVP